MSRATLRTTHADPAVVAAALAPDNTPEMRTAVVDGAVETRIERPTAAGLRTTVDDYLVCLSAATAVAAEGGDHPADSDPQAIDSPTDRTPIATDSDEHEDHEERSNTNQ
jgi:hypothetical protein